MTVRPGTGWPGDPATSDTPVAQTGADVAELAHSAATAQELAARVSVCRACPRLVEWREGVAATKRRAYAGEQYWGRPVPGFGPPRPSILVVGLAPGAHGANRTGRNFTGDRSGEWLYASLYRCGLANQPTVVSADDGLALAARGSSPPSAARRRTTSRRPAERDTCRPWLVRELELLWPTTRAVVVLGGVRLGRAAGRRCAASARRAAAACRSSGTASRCACPTGGLVLGCYHVSQQNTFTGRLTEAMLDAVLRPGGRPRATVDRSLREWQTPIVSSPRIAAASTCPVTRRRRPGPPACRRRAPEFDVSRDLTPGVPDHAAPDDEE